jgi:hypothetical protein
MHTIVETEPYLAQVERLFDFEERSAIVRLPLIQNAVLSFLAPAAFAS